MLANVREEYVFRTIDPAEVSPEGKIKRPKRLLIIALGIFIGGWLGIFSALFRNYLHKQQENLAAAANPS